ncbi:MAG TPA: MerC family mercury resistance protein, partial [Dokdonella sp.]|nr:MerC family mercury resistance protein [Dokdonella sp.]
MLDRVGTVIAGLCAVHCALVPIAIASTSSFTLALLSWRDPHHALALWLLTISAWEAWVVAGALAFAGLSLGLQFPMHRDRRPAAL